MEQTQKITSLILALYSYKDTPLQILMLCSPLATNLVCWIQIMSVGGNGRARQFFKQHGWSELGADKIEQKVLFMRLGFCYCREVMFPEDMETVMPACQGRRHLSQQRSRHLTFM